MDGPWSAMLPTVPRMVSRMRINWDTTCRSEYCPKGSNSLDVDLLRSKLLTENCGLVSFVGITRGYDDGEEVLRLEFDAWQEKLSETLRLLSEEAIEKFELKSVAIAHRTGSVGPGENIVVIIFQAHTGGFCRVYSVMN